METIKAKPLNEWTSLEIAVYAVNCPNDDERADEVAKLIESYARQKVNEQRDLMAKWLANHFNMRNVPKPTLLYDYN